MVKIIDFLIQIKNAYLAKKDNFYYLYSQTIEEVSKILKKENYIKDYQIEEKDKKRLIKIDLLYLNNMAIFTDLKIFSKPGRRIYVKINNLKPVLGGRGIAVLSTPKGIISDKEARKLKVGGELWFQIW